MSINVYYNHTHYHPLFSQPQNFRSLWIYSDDGDYDNNIGNGDDDHMMNMTNNSFGMFNTIWLHDPPGEIVWKSLVVALICLVGLTGNFLVIFMVLRQPTIRRQPVNIYIVNLAIADFLTVL